MLSPKALIRAAKKSKHHSHKHACIIFRGGRVVSVATNDERRHAEVRALNKLRSGRKVPSMKDVTVLSVRVGKGGDLRNAQPCEACMKFLLEHGVRDILYTSETGYIERVE